MSGTLRRVLGVLYICIFLVAMFNYNSRCRTSIVKPQVPEEYSEKSGLKLCSADNLGVVQVDIFAHPTITEVEAENSDVQKGGRWKPKDCFPYQKVAILVPYRDRLHHLHLLLQRLHPMLQRQKLQYQIFVIEQAGTEHFNRGRLMNIGFVESLKLDNFDCFVFHDVDLLPENDKNLYMCDGEARHLSSAIDESRYHVMYYNYAGGVIALNRTSFVKINGYSNDYWGWGKEDDDFSARTMEGGLLLSRPPAHIGRYKMVRHLKEYQAPNGYDLFLTWRSRWITDGLNSLQQNKYKLLEKIEEKLYTVFRVDIGKAPSHPPMNRETPKESLIWFFQYFFP